MAPGAQGEINKQNHNIFFHHQVSISAGWLGLIKPLVYYILQCSFTTRLHTHKTHRKGPSTPRPQSQHKPWQGGLEGGQWYLGVPQDPPPRLLALLQLYSSWECSPVWVDSLGIAGTGGSMQLRKGQQRLLQHWAHQNTSPGDGTPTGHGHPALIRPCH